MRRISALIAGLLVAAAPAVPVRAQPASNAAPQAAPKLTKPPRLVKFVDAPYPESEKAAGKTGVGSA